MAGQTIAEGVVLVTADAKNIPKEIARDIDSGQSEMAATGNRAGSKLFAGIGKFALGAVATVGTIGVAVGGLALKGGFDRALSIQDAQKKLEGLGHDTTAISSIMDSALNSVRGTAFGLGAAATTSASLVAAGVDLGGELERRLKTVADTATIAGRSMEDVGTIFGSVAAKGKLQGDDLLQLMSSGVPVLQFLAEHLGKTSEEISEMVSKGEIDFATFADAMEAGIGGAALKGGETARGAFSNVMAALSRLGEGFAAPIVAAAPGLFTSIAGAVDQIGTALKPVTTAFGEWLTPALERLSAWIDQVDWSTVGQGVLAFSPLANVLSLFEPLLPILESAGREVFPVLRDAFDEIRESLAPVLPMLGETLVDAIVKLTPELAELLRAVIPIIPSLVDLAVLALPPMVDALMLIVPPLADFVELMADLLEPVNEIIDVLSGNTTFQDLGEHVLGSRGALSEFGDMVYDIYIGVTEWMGQVGQAFSDFNENHVQPAITGALTIFGIFAGIAEWVFLNVVEPAIRRVADAFTWLGQNVFGPIGAFIGGVFQNLSGVFTTFYTGVVKPVFDNVAAVFTWVWQNIISPVTSQIDGGVRKIGDTSKSVFGGFADFVGGAFQGALNMVKGPINGIIDLVNRAIRGLNGLSVTIPDWVPEVGGQTWGLDLPTIPKLAKGGVIRTGGTVMVGDAGPEYLSLPPGAQVTPLARRDALPTQQSGNAPFVAGDLNIYESTDPLGSAGRLAKANRMYRTK